MEASMNEEKIRELYNAISMLDVNFYALKWIQTNNKVWELENIISSYDYILKELKRCCINTIGYPEEDNL